MSSQPEKVQFLSPHEYLHRKPRWTYLLSHLLHLAGGVASLVALFYPQAEHRLPSSARPRHALHASLLTLRLPELGFRTDRLHVVHVICLHHLGNSIKRASEHDAADKLNNNITMQPPTFIPQGHQVHCNLISNVWTRSF